ncbi:hypothetical protein [Sediminicurvatus halobius]|uniref:hypothetical protein n=1 Tax=Sediminicurvatus halobius TaxID=2182432 RepID=UPI0011B1F882|nr:hypothetical protein [Spiribacter halobius]UEX77463.1 hypothetical protein LMH63_16225 [Spiribacter halobius]
MIRDPKDVLLSYVHYVAGEPRHYLHDAYKVQSLENRIRTTLRGGRICGLDVPPFSTMLRRVQAWIDMPNTTVVRFEDLVGPKGGGSDDCQAAAFDQLSRVTGVRFTPSEIAPKLFGKSSTFRKGRIGMAEEELCEYTLQEVDQELGGFREAWGYA